jgi:glycerophosphoryl diester phosphodiesterase
MENTFKDLLPNLLIRYLNLQTSQIDADHWLFHNKIAHRGLHNETYPENSISSFKQAISNQYAIELDIHLLADGEIVVFHDEDLLRVTGNKGLLKNLTAEDLCQYTLAGSEETIPLLKDVLELVAGKVPLVIEIKNLKRIGKLENQLLLLLKDYKGEVAIQSFNHLSLVWFRLKRPEIARGMLSSLNLGKLNLIKNSIVKNYLLYPLVAPTYIGHDVESLNSNIVGLLKKHCDIPLIAWTIKNEEQYQEILAYCENIIFEGFRP